MIDSIRAARAAAFGQGVALSGKVMLTGYSQGGHSSMAAHRAIERDNAGEINVVAGAHLAGPYNLSGSFKYPRDEVARFLGVDDATDRIHWIYTQTKAVQIGSSVKEGRTKASPDYDTRPTVTIEVMPVQDIDPQAKRVRELEDEIERTRFRANALHSCLRRWVEEGVQPLEAKRLIQVLT